MMVRKMAVVMMMLGVMAGCAGEAAIEKPTRVITETPQPTEPFMDKEAMARPTQLLPTPSATTPPPITPAPAPTFTATPAIHVRGGTPFPSPFEVITVGNALQVRELARWGYGAVRDVSFVSNDKLMIAATTVTIYAYTPGTFDEQWRIEVDAGISAFSTSTNQEQFAFGTYDGAIHVVDAVGGAEIIQWQAHEGEILSLAFSTDDAMLASGGQDHYTRVWDLSSARQIVEHQFNREPERVFFTKNNEWVASRVWNSNYGDEYVFLDWDAGSIEDIHMEADYIYGLDPANDLYMNGFDVTQISTQEVVSSLVYGEELTYGWGILSADFSDDGSMVALGLDHYAVWLWRVEDGTEIGMYRTDAAVGGYAGKLQKIMPRSGPGPGAVYSVTISPDGSLLAGRNGYGEIFVWEIAGKRLLRKYHSWGGSIAFAPDNDTLIVSSGSSIEFFSTRLGQRFAYKFEAGGELLFSPKSTRLASGSRLWTMETGLHENTPIFERILGFSENGSYFYTIAPQWWVRQRRTDNLEMRRQASLEIPTIEDEWWGSSIPYRWYEMGGWEISPDGERIHASSYEMPVLCWKTDGGAYLFYTGGSPYSITTYSPSGQYFLDYGSVGGLSVFDIQSGIPDFLYRVPIKQNLADDVIVSPDNRLIIIPAEERVYVLDIATGDELYRIKVPYDAEYFYTRSAAVSPDGMLLVVSVSNIMYFYNLDNGELLGMMEGHFETIYSIAFSPDGTLLATAAYDGTVRLWGIPAE